MLWFITAEALKFYELVRWENAIHFLYRPVLEFTLIEMISKYFDNIYEMLIIQHSVLKIICAS